MKAKSIFIQACIVLIALLSFSCTESDVSDINEPELTYEEKEHLFLKEFRQKVRGSWKVEKMVISKNNNHNDSIVYDVGEIFVNNINNDPINTDRYNQLQACFYINNEVIHFHSCLLSYPKEDNYLEFNGVTGLMLEGYPFYSEISSNSSSEEYRFIFKYFLGDSYIMILSEDEKTWTWKGLNRLTREIVLTKK